MKPADKELEKIANKELYRIQKDGAMIDIGSLDDDMTFYPEAYSSKWGEECWLKISHKDKDKIKSGKKAKETLKNGKINLELDVEGTGRIHNFREGSLKWDVTYTTVDDIPFDDTERFTLEFPDTLTWHEQTKEAILNEHSDAVYADNIPNSYVGYIDKAFRIIDESGNEIVDYGCGKFCHLYRSKMIAADGAETWINQEIIANELLEHIPREWCITHGFPIILDPTIGYDNEGASSTSQTSVILASGLGTATENGTVDSIDIYCSNTSAANDVKVGRYTDSSGAASLIETESEHTDIGVFPVQWKSFFHTGNITDGTSYWHAMSWFVGNATIYFDSLGGTNRYSDSATYGDAWPSTFVQDSSSGAAYSIRATYTATGGATLLPIIMNYNQKMRA